MKHLGLACVVLLGAASALAQTPARVPQQPPPAGTTAPAGVVPPADYVIGADDVLDVVVWREKDLSATVKVRPDGKVSLPLLNDIQAAGMTPEEFRAQVSAAVAKFVADPAVSVIIQQINSRKVFIMGEVAKPGEYSLTAPMNVLQLIALSGGLTEFADAKGISVMRTENGRARQLKFNYRDVVKGKKLEQNVPLRPGDTVIVP